MNDLTVLNTYLSGELSHTIVSNTITILINNGFGGDLQSFNKFSLVELVQHCIFDIESK